MDIAGSKKSLYYYSQNCSIKNNILQSGQFFWSFRQHLSSTQKTTNTLDIQGSNAFLKKSYVDFVHLWSLSSYSIFSLKAIL